MLLSYKEGINYIVLHFSPMSFSSLNTLAYTAIANVDYNSTSEQIRFSAAETVKLVRIPIRDDPYTEYNEQFNVSLSTSDDDVNLLKKTATVVIHDNDGKYTKGKYM